MKKTIYTLLAVLALLFTAALPAEAHRGGGHFGFWFGPVWPVFPYYYAPPPQVIIREQPEIYYEAPQPEEPQYWYYCTNPQGYYPYVKSCPDGWMKVVPKPPAGKE